MSTRQIEKSSSDPAEELENVDDFMSKASSFEVTLGKFQETVAKYKFMEFNYMNRKKGLETRIPEIKKTLTVVEFLISMQDSDESIETTFELNDTLWAAAKVKSTKTVYLWLGANVMLEYELQEAKELLETKLSTAQSTLDFVIEDLEFMREQITTMEVSILLYIKISDKKYYIAFAVLLFLNSRFFFTDIARVYNWDVKRRRHSKTDQSEEKS
ncbi:17530_t:CDS:2 [Cetraspora pellucida]|uniref:17530_t:CDS:1 n=1 Tax=Cetraspora pellucida TaxID=1433469 RepID=A0ACA9MAY2_9GLOM|nr:17530_t:CDS:2 [Cetraspora pellucida]